MTSRRPKMQMATESSESSLRLAQEGNNNKHDYKILRQHYSKPGKKLPQTIAHRGFKKLYPENTLSAFRGAVETGSHAIETDLQLSRDGVVVISHDATTRRCFGVNKKINESDWEELSVLRTLREPHDRMPRLSDLLEYLASPGVEDVWVLLDIKMNNDARTILKRIAETVHTVPALQRPWHERILLGCWSSSYFPLCEEYLPGHPIALITFDILAARHFLKTTPSLSFNVFYKSLMSPLGYRFVEAVHDAPDSRMVLAWTVNRPRHMRWCIRRGVDGVITDDPQEFRRICDEWEDDDEEIDAKTRAEDRKTLLEHVELVLVALLVVLFGWTFRYRTLRLQRLIVEDSSRHPEMKQGYPKT